MQYLTYGLSLNGVDLKRIYRYVCDLRDVDHSDYLLVVTQCNGTWPGMPTTGDEYLRQEQDYNTAVTYIVGITGYNLIKQNQTLGDVLRCTVRYVKYADGNYTVEQNV